MNGWKSRKFWSQIAAAVAVNSIAIWLEKVFVDLLERKLITGEIYSSLASGIFWTAVVFTGAAVGLYALSNVSMEWIHKRGDR